MSLYGSGIYGISTYGDSKSIAYNIGFTADTIDYRTVNLSWDVTAVNDSDIVYAWKIIKTVGGVPDYPNQGQLVTSFVDGGPYAGKKIIDGKYTDVDAVFPSSSIITYSFWGLIGVNSTVVTWKLLGAADAVIVDNDSDDTTLRILRLLPGAWTSNAAEALGEPDTDTQLYNFVGAFAFYYDKLRAQAGAINNLSDYRKYPKELLPSAVISLGFTYEPKLGDSFHRSLYKNGHLINSLKGTYLGLNNYIKSLTHFKSMISVGKNMMLDYLQSSFEGSVGTWGTVKDTNTGIWSKVGTSGFTAGSRATNSITSPTLGLAGSYLSDGYGILTKSAITISSLTTNASIVSQAIVDGTTWTITTATAHGFVVGDSGSVAGVHPTQFNTTFTVGSVISATKFTVTSGIDEYSTITATHASGAATATITFPSAHGLASTDQITISAASGVSIAAQFLNTFTVTYISPTQVTIPIATGTAVTSSVAALVKCLITNVSATATIGNPFLLSYSSPEVTDTTTKTFLVTPGTPYLFSGWALTKTGTSLTVQAQIQWFDATGTLLSTTSTGTQTVINSSSWTKFESSSTYSAIFAPTGAMYAGVKILTTNMAINNAIYFDNFMFSVYPGLIGNREYGSGDFIYEDAKQILINLEGYRTNLISNPGFEDSVGFWNAVNGQLLSDFSPPSITISSITSASSKFTVTTATPHGFNAGNATTISGTNSYVGSWIIESVPSVTTFVVNSSTSGTFTDGKLALKTLMAGSTNVCKFTSTAAGSSAIYTQWIRNLKPGKEYTFSAYVLAPANGITATANIEWDMPQSLENQTTIVVSTVSGYEGKYRPTVSSKVSSSETIVNNSSWTRISVTGTAPEFTKINGFASAMVSIEFTASAGSENWYLDCALFEDSSTVNTYFQGNGGIIPSSALPTGGSLAPIITDDIIPVGDTAWETKGRINFIANPSFEGASVANWTAKANTTTSFTATNTGLSAKFETYKAEAVYTGTTLHNYGIPEISTIFYYPSKSTATIPPFPTGGEQITLSAYVAHDSIYTGTFTIQFTDNTTSKVTSNVFKIPPANTTTPTATDWYRIHVTGVVDKPLYTGPSGTLTITFNVPTESGGKVYIDGVQAELGSYPTTFVNTQSDAILVGTVSGTNQYATNSIMSSIGRSYYWPNIDLKYSRLLNTVSNYLPIGSTYTLTKGVPARQKDENISSIVPSYSFENNLYGWSRLTNNTISRYASAGSKSSIKGFTSASWLIAANTAGTGTIGAQTEFHVSPGTLYQFAANIYAPTSVTATTRTGTPKIQITWYTDSTKTTVIGSAVNVTAEVSSRNAENRWAVLLGQVTSPISSGGAYYAVMSIFYTPSPFSGTTSDNIVYIDDVVCVPL